MGKSNNCRVRFAEEANIVHEVTGYDEATSRIKWFKKDDFNTLDDELDALAKKVRDEPSRYAYSLESLAEAEDDTICIRGLERALTPSGHDEQIFLRNCLLQTLFREQDRQRDSTLPFYSERLAAKLRRLSKQSERKARLRGVADELAVMNLSWSTPSKTSPKSDSRWNTTEDSTPAFERTRLVV